MPMVKLANPIVTTTGAVRPLTAGLTQKLQMQIPITQVLQQMQYLIDLIGQPTKLIPLQETQLQVEQFMMLDKHHQ